jgi:hypothetical protein
MVMPDDGPEQTAGVRPARQAHRQSVDRALDAGEALCVLSCGEFSPQAAQLLSCPVPAEPETECDRNGDEEQGQDEIGFMAWALHAVQGRADCTGRYG